MTMTTSNNQPKYDAAPSYYTGPNGTTCWDAVDTLGLFNDYYLATAFSYLWRCGRKPGNGAASDVRKAYNYLGRWLENEQLASSFAEEPVDTSTTGSVPVVFDGGGMAPSDSWVAPEEPEAHEVTLMDRLKASIRGIRGGAVGA